MTTTAGVKPKKTNECIALETVKGARFWLLEIVNANHQCGREVTWRGLRVQIEPLLTFKLGSAN